MNYRYLVNIDSLTSKKYINNSKFLKNNILLRSYHQNIHYKYVSHSEWQILKNQGYDIEIKREYDEEANIVDEYPRFVTFNLHIDNIVINKVHQCNSNLCVNEIIGVLFSAQDYIVKSNDQVIDSTLQFNNFDDILCLDIYCQQVCGLANLGNTCFMNSALQCVYNLDNFRLHILSYNYKGEITNALKNLFGEMGIKKFYTPREFRNSFGRTNNQFMDYNQHDAEEFMRALLNSVDDEIKKDLQTSKKDTYEAETEKGDEQEKVIEIERRDESVEEQNMVDETQSDKCKDESECNESKSIENIANNSMDRVSFESQDKYIEEVGDNENKNNSNSHAMNGGSEESKEMQNNREIQSNRECENEIKHKRIETTSNTKNDSNTSKAETESETKRNLRKIESIPQTDTNSDEKPTNVKTVIDDLFKGVTMSTQSCLSCNTSSTVTEPFLFLSLPIPTEKVVHSKAYLVRNGFIEKLLTPRTITVKCLKYKLKDLGIENVMIISTNNERRILLRDTDCISTYENIICYEYNPSNVYFWLILRKTKYSILRDFFFFHMLIELSDFESILSQVKKNLEFFGDYDSIDNFNTRISKEIINNIHKTSLINRERHLLTSQPDSRIYDLDPSLSFHRTIQEITVEAQDHNTLFTKISHVINLYDCLDFYFTKEYLLNGDKYGCLECKKVNEHSKAIRLCSLPKFFIIHLSRFSFYKKSKKVNNFIDFSLVLTHKILQKYFGVDCEVRDYELVCVSNHLNLCSMSGHYTAYVWRKNKWWLINDGVVTEVNEIKKDDAYILFYRAKDI